MVRREFAEDDNPARETRYSARRFSASFAKATEARAIPP
jgi:hypothetical protein